MAIICDLLSDDNNINGIFNPAVDPVFSRKNIKLVDIDGNLIATTTIGGSKGKFGSSTEINIDDANSGSTLQQIDCYTSSDIIQLSDQIGSEIVIGYTGQQYPATSDINAWGLR